MTRGRVLAALLVAGFAVAGLGGCNRNAPAGTYVSGGAGGAVSTDQKAKPAY